MSARIDDALVQEVRDRTDIVQVVADYVSLKKAGTHLKGLCPFHNEKTPSFTVHPGRQFYYCFGCQTGGDAISFLREIQGLSFVEAVRQLADRAGIAIPEPRLERHDASHGRGSADRGGAPRTSRAGREALFGVGREAQRFFAEQLQTMAGQRCRDYLRERGIEAAAIERFGLGFAPASWDGLVGHLVGRREDLAIAVQAGLLGAKKSGRGYYDRFRDRLMFPIRSLGGEVVAFGGRILPSSTDDPEAAKYINSPDTPVYDKGRTLFGLYEARRAMRSAGHAVLVEGNLDVVRLSQAGIENVVAPMGTALTPEQCRLARRFVPRLILVLDGDRAGRAAAEKAVPAALAEGLAVGVVSLPVGEDPDSFVGRHGADALRAEIDNAVEGWDFLVEATVGAMAGRDGRIAGLGDAIAALAPVLAGISNRGERLLYQRRLAGRVGVDDAALAELLGSVRPGRRAPQEPARPAARAQIPTTTTTSHRRRWRSRSTTISDDRRWRTRCSTSRRRASTRWWSSMRRPCGSTWWTSATSRYR